MTALGLPDFGPVQQNVSYNGARGVTRGVHAEPWDKFVSVATGRAYGAWVDLREGPSFGTTYTHELEPGHRGLRAAWRRQRLPDARGRHGVHLPGQRRTGVPTPATPTVNLADPTLAIDWPIPLDDPSVELSQKDRDSPALADVTPMAAAPVLVVGGSGQVGHGAAPGVPGSPRAAAFGARPGRPGLGGPLRLLVVRRGAERRGLHRRRRRRDRPPRRLGGQRHRTRPARGAGHAARLHPRARLLRLRLRRHASRSTPRTSPCRRWGSTARARPPATSPWPPRPGTTCCARPGWSATATTSCAPCSAWPTTASRRPWSPTRSAG